MSDNEGNIETTEAVETSYERFNDAFLGLIFFLIALKTAQRMSYSTKAGGGSEAIFVTAFYSLILLTSSLRFVWFAIPKSISQTSYTPTAVQAFDEGSSDWVGIFLSQIILTAGSLALFSIFILILVYWADILKKYFYPGARRFRPMMIFATSVITLVVLEVLNAVFFLSKFYSSEGMILFDSLLLSAVSLVCVVQFTIFSHRFRTVLKTLGAINQVSTESQVRRIVWITVTGNLFFFTRAFEEAILTFFLASYWHRYGSVSMVFTHGLWDTYMVVKHWSEVAILCLMLYSLQSRFTAVARDGYEVVGEISKQQADAMREEEQPLVV